MSQRVLLVAVICVAAVAAAAPAFEVFVDPAKGSDVAAGTLAAPLRTIHAAQRKVQQLKRPLAADCFVTLRAGTYFMNRTLSLYSPNDGGSATTAKVVYRTYAADLAAGKRATLSGGTELKGFAKNPTSGFFELKVPDGIQPFQ